MVRSRGGVGYKRPQSQVHKELADYVRVRDGGICIYCEDAVGQEIDHVMPSLLGGPTIKENLVLTCSSCNSKKRYNWDGMIGKALRHLVTKGESLDWIDEDLQSENKF